MAAPPHASRRPRRPFQALALSALATAVPLVLAAGVASLVAAGGAPSLRIMSFNLRLDLASDGANAWPHRKDWVASLIRFHAPDVVGVQEALSPMLADLEARLPGFGRVGAGRDDGREGGEFSAILYRRERLEVVRQGTFWLSPTPEVPGSLGWDAAYPRVATWAEFRDTQSGCRYLHLNTHLDHRGEEARREGARLIRRRLAALSPGLPIVLTGDLNATPGSEPYRVLTRDEIADASPPLHDAFTTSRDGHYGPTSTWTGFEAIEPGRRIDYVLVSAGVEVLTHGILSDSWDGRFPSDHLPVVATVEIGCR